MYANLLTREGQKCNSLYFSACLRSPSCALFQCQLGVLPLGTGNDLARVLGWGGSYDDDTQLPQILEKLERASTKMLDR